MNAHFIFWHTYFQCRPIAFRTTYIPGFNPYDIISLFIPTMSYCHLFPGIIGTYPFLILTIAPINVIPYLLSLCISRGKCVTIFFPVMALILERGNNSPSFRHPGRRDLHHVHNFSFALSICFSNALTAFFNAWRNPHPSWEATNIP